MMMNFKTELPRQIGRRWLGMVLVIGFLTVILVQPALACPTCKQALAENGQSQDGLVRGYFWSILFMMSMPFLIFCGMGYYFGSQVRRAREQQLLAMAGGTAVSHSQESSSHH
jgi:heme/copper-type cytochrome/quinol oxidase subunit 2